MYLLPRLRRESSRALPELLSENRLPPPLHFFFLAASDLTNNQVALPGMFSWQLGWPANKRQLPFTMLTPFFIIP